MPPPLPFFIGRTIDATERDDFLLVRPKANHAFRAPPGTNILYVEAARIAAVARVAGEQDGEVQLAFTGDLRRSGYGGYAVLGPVDPVDADAFVAAIAKRYALPRVPRPCAVSELLPERGHAHVGHFIVATGLYQPGHFEASDFEGIKIIGDRALLAALVPGRRFVVTGFVSPGTRPGAMPHPGYNGVSLHATAIEPEAGRQSR